MVQHEKFQSAPGSRVGTPAYLAPEVIMTTKGQTYDGKVILLSLGCSHLIAFFVLKAAKTFDGVAQIGCLEHLCPKWLFGSASYMSTSMHRSSFHAAELCEPCSTHTRQHMSKTLVT